MADITLPTNLNFRNLTGQKFDRLWVASFHGRLAKPVKLYPYWNCICSCGNAMKCQGARLLNGTTTSCGCYQRESVSARFTKHGHARMGAVSSEYESWHSMIQRCTNPKNPKFKIYGGRGIKVCERWTVFENFLADMGLKSNKSLSIERIDGNGNYEPGNCKWATDKEQCRNMRKNRWITYKGETKIISDWAEETGINPSTISSRLRRKKPLEEVFAK